MERLSKQLFAFELDTQEPPDWIVRHRRKKNPELALIGENVQDWGTHLKAFYQDIFSKAYALRQNNRYTHNRLRTIVSKELEK